MGKDFVKFSVYLSLLLRHKPEEIHLKMNEEGWVEVSHLLEQLYAESYYKDITLDDLKYIVDTDNKKRYSLRTFDGKLYIRANQGHSIKGINLHLEPVDPPNILYHGTGVKYLNSIMKIGLIKKERQYVHLSATKKVAITVGKRHGDVAVFEIAAQEMQKDGFIFYLSENGVWLTDNVPVKYLNRII